MQLVLVSFYNSKEMKNSRNIFQIIVGMFVLMVSSESIAQRQVLIDTKRDFSGIQRIEASSGMLEMEYLGDPNKQDVSVDVYLESTNTNQDVVFVAVGDVLKITYQQNNSGSNSWKGSQTKGYIKISGPEQMLLELSAGSGTIKVDQVIAAQTKLRVASGSMDVSNVTGALDAKASSGRISIRGLNGDLMMSASSGSASLTDIMGKANVSLVSGSVKGSNIEGPLSLKISSGSAKLAQVKQIESVNSVSGSAEFTKSGLSDLTNLKSSSGSIKIKTTSSIEDYNYNLKASSGSLRVGNNSKGKALQINNGSSKMVNGSVVSGSISIEN
jgi:lia operon protein LiaG